MIKRTYPVLLCFLFVLISTASYAEEGMWTLDNLPLKQLKARYGFTPSKDWLEKVQLASVRFNDGGSGSFVSSTGLVLTNHHVAVGQLQKMSSPEKDYVKEGFLAADRAEEIKCTDLELNVLITMENVTAVVKEAIKKLTGKEAIKERKKVLAALEKERGLKSGYRVDAVTLYNGGEYWLYSYKRYRDVRLVMAPEKQIAFYGGSYDNFTYPRHDLDFALFRVYENDQPLKTGHYFPLNPGGIRQDDLVFVSGHPGSTRRLITCSQFLLNRDYIFPNQLSLYRGVMDTLKKYSARGTEQKRQAASLYFGYDNSFKAFSGEYKTLKDPAVAAHFKKEEKRLQSLVKADPQLHRETGEAWNSIEKAQKMLASRFNETTYRTLRGYRLPALASGIVFYVKETKKPDGERLQGYHDSQLDTWRYINLSPAPLYPDMEEALLAFHLSRSLEKLGSNDEFVRILLGGKSPADRARELVKGTKLADPAFRKKLIEGGVEGLAKSGDPLIQLALKLEPSQRDMIKWRENTIETLVTPSSEAIARARLKVMGKSAYPDATFTLRLSYGTVRSYPMNGTMAAPFTTFYGLYDRYYGFSGKGDWWLPERYIQKKDSLDMATPLNFVMTNDIIGGNSGSPVINKAGELVGLIFDGNMESLAGNFIYSGVANRAVAVHGSAIIQALRKLYDAGAIADELIGEKNSSAGK
jgi:hypothetical protein